MSVRDTENLEFLTTNYEPIVETTASEDNRRRFTRMATSLGVTLHTVATSIYMAAAAGNFISAIHDDSPAVRSGDFDVTGLCLGFTVVELGVLTMQLVAARNSAQPERYDNIVEFLPANEPLLPQTVAFGKE